jgi:hypothetical protein
MPAPYVNPYYSQSEYISRVATLIDSTVDVCLLRNNPAVTDLVVKLAELFIPAKMRRLHEFSAPTSSSRASQHLSDWFIDLDMAIRDMLEELEDFNQELPWDYETDRLLPANLTQKRLGRTAEWFMVNSFGESEDLQDLLARQQQDANDVYTHSTTKAVRGDEKCENAAENSDILVLVLAMAATFCGGVVAFTNSMHLMMNWIFVRVRPRSSQTRGSPPSGWYTLLPTYELGLTLFGALVFFSLYLPVVFQVKTEFEIHGYATRGSDLMVHKTDLIDHQFMGAAALVTIALTETKCSESRPYLLLAILINGCLLGILVNLPHAHMSYVVLARYIKRFRNGGEQDMPADCTVFDTRLRIITIPTEEDKEGLDSGNSIATPTINVPDPSANSPTPEKAKLLASVF